MKRAHLMLAGLSLGLMTACAEDDFSAEEQTLDAQAASDLQHAYPSYDLTRLRLPEAEYTQSRLQEDEQWMAARMQEAGVDSIELDHSQPRDLLYTLRRLHFSGVTPETHPHLYTLLAASVAGDIPRPQSAKSEATATSTWCDFHFSTWQTSTSTSSVTLHEQANSGCSGGAPYVYKDLITYKLDTKTGSQALLGSTYVEEFDEGKAVTLDLKSQVIPYTHALRSTSEVIAILSDGSMKSTATAEQVDAGCTIVPTAPVDGNGDGKTNVCQNGRSGCDYVMNAAAGRMMAPWAGTYTYMVKNSSGSLYKSVFKGFSSYAGKIYAPTYGTYCGGASLTSLNYTFVSGSATTLSTSHKVDIKRFDQDYGAQCYAASTLVFMNANVKGYGQYDSNADGKIDGNDPVKYCSMDSWSGAIDNTPQQFYWVEGCVREGTDVTLADGTVAAIDDLYRAREYVRGQRVRGEGGSFGVIEDVTTGDDQTFVRLEDELGHVVELTRTHPVMTPLGPVPAELMQAGDMVDSVDGPTRLLSVNTVYSPGLVYNLVIKPEKPASASATYGTFIAGGIEVGDQQLQLLAEQHSTRLPKPATRENWVSLFRELRLYR